MACSFRFGSLRRPGPTVSMLPLRVSSVLDRSRRDNEGAIKLAQVSQKGSTSAFQSRQHTQQLGRGAHPPEAANVSAFQEKVRGRRSEVWSKEGQTTGSVGPGATGWRCGNAERWWRESDISRTYARDRRSLGGGPQKVISSFESAPFFLYVTYREAGVTSTAFYFPAFQRLIYHSLNCTNWVLWKRRIRCGRISGSGVYYCLREEGREPEIDSVS